MKNRLSLILALATFLALYRFYSRVLRLHRNGKCPLATDTPLYMLRTILSMFAATVLAPVLLWKGSETPKLVYKRTAANL